MRESWVWFLRREDPLEKGTATHSSILAGRIPWTEEPGGLQFMGSERIEQDSATFTFTGSHSVGLFPLFLFIGVLGILLLEYKKP